MQFHLEPDERKCLADLLLEQEVGKYSELLDKILDRDLRLDVDELGQVAALLANKKDSLKNEIVRRPQEPMTLELQRQLALLERVLEKVNEACVMF